jgi:hypothetical protein
MLSSVALVSTHVVQYWLQFKFFYLFVPLQIPFGTSSCSTYELHLAGCNSTFITFSYSPCFTPITQHWTCQQGLIYTYAVCFCTRDGFNTVLIMPMVLEYFEIFPDKSSSPTNDNLYSQINLLFPIFGYLNKLFVLLFNQIFCFAI